MHTAYGSGCMRNEDGDRPSDVVTQRGNAVMVASLTPSLSRLSVSSDWVTRKSAVIASTSLLSCLLISTSYTTISAQRVNCSQLPRVQVVRRSAPTPPLGARAACIVSAS